MDCKTNGYRYRAKTWGKKSKFMLKLIKNGENKEIYNFYKRKFCDKFLPIFT